MLQLFNPISLLAAAAVIIPVIIHLWNTRRGKTLKVGSIALLTESSRKPAQSLRITNWPLLLLRCVLLILVALLMSEPFWQNKERRKQGGWAIIPANELGNAYAEYSMLIDSLLQQGFELRNLQTPHQIITLADSGVYKNETGNPATNTWSSLRYLDAGLPPGFPVYCFSSERSENFAGKRPITQLDLHWISLNDGKNSDTLPVSIYLDHDSKWSTTSLLSTSYGNYFKDITGIPASSADTTGTINVGIYAGSNTADARYVKAAIEAIAAYTGRSIIINESPVPLQQQVIFWLQETEPEKNVLASLVTGGMIFRYDSVTPSSLQLPAPGNNGSAGLQGSDPDLFFNYTKAPSKGAALWTVRGGEPLMSVSSEGSFRTIHFASRFNPQSTDIVWKESFARLLIPVILPSFKISGPDLRKISPEQAQPRHVQQRTTGGISGSIYNQKTSLSFITWIIAFLVFAAERILSYHQSRRNA